MNQEEWLAEFERVHGRPATREEIQEAFGMFGSPETQATPDTPVNPIQSPFEGAAPVSNQGQFGGPLPFPEQAKFGDAAPTPEQTQFGGATPTPEQTPFGGATPTPEQTQFGGPTPTQAPFGGASSAPNQFQGGTSPFQQQGQAFGQGGVQPQAPVQGSAQAGATFSPYNNSQMQGGYPNNGQLNYQTNSPYMGQAPIPGKKSKKGLIIGLCSLVAVAILAVLAFFLFFKNSNNIQGKWSATPEMKKTMKSAFSGTFSTASDISSEFVKDMDMIVEVEGKKVTISVIGKIDFKGAAKELYDDGDNDFYSVEDALDYIQENSENSYLEDLGLEIDVKKGTLKMVAFEGEVDEKDHRFIQDEDASHFLKYDLKYKIENGTLKVSVDGNDYGIEYSFKK
jgi:variant surface antigen F